MNPNDLQALMALGKVGLDALGSRMLSMTSLLGVIALAAYTAWRPTYEGVALTAILALLTFIPALKAEGLRRIELKGVIPHE